MEPENINNSNQPAVHPMPNQQNSEEHISIIRLIVFLFVIALILAPITYLVYSKYKTPTQKNSIANNGATKVNISRPVLTSGEGRLSDIWKQAGYRKCSVSISYDGSEVGGVLFLANGDLRADFGILTTQTGDNTPSSSIIFRDGELYTWNNITLTGFQTKVSGISDPLAATGYGKYSAAKIGKYNCEDWSYDSSKFAPPKNVKFKNFSK